MMTTVMDPLVTFAMIVVLFGGFRLLLLALAPFGLLYGLYRLIKWII